MAAYREGEMQRGGSATTPPVQSREAARVHLCKDTPERQRTSPSLPWISRAYVYCDVEPSSDLLMGIMGTVYPAIDLENSCHAGTAGNLHV